MLPPKLVGSDAPVDVILEKGHHSFEDIEIILTPGHTDGSICFFYRSPTGKSYLFTGDTVFRRNGQWATLVLRNARGVADGHRPDVPATEPARLTGQSDRASWRPNFVRYSPGEASRRPRLVLYDPSRAGHAQGELQMKKSDIATYVADWTKVSKGDAEAAVNAVLGVITDGLARGEAVSIAGFGTFTVKHRPARQGRNPRTGEPIGIAASSVPSFKAGKGLRDAVN